jgi:uncharacterized membrane protein YkoI
MKKWIITIVAVLLMLTAVSVGAVYVGNGSKAKATVVEQKQGADEKDDVQEPSYTGSIKVPEPEPNDLNSLATVTAEQATAAALQANPGTTAKATELNNENGSLVWGVELSNGADVKVDAGDGKVLLTEQPDPNEPEGESKESVEEQDENKPDTDNVQEGNQKDDERGDKPETEGSTTK